MFLLPILIPACAKSTLPVFYKWNNGVWMSAHLFTMWLNEYVKLTLLDLLLRKKNFFQNITSHFSLGHPRALMEIYNEINVIFMPANTTSILQSMK